MIRTPMLNRIAAAVLSLTLVPFLLRAEDPDLLDDELLTDGWIQLFDGHSLYGWKKANDANWRVENGAIVVDTGEMGLLCTTAKFEDFELHVEFRAAKGTNSGIFTNTPLVPKSPGEDCYEINIAPPDNPFPTGSVVQRRKGADVDVAAGEWHTYNIRVDNGRIELAIDGKETCRYEDPNPLGPGHIGLQLNQGRVEFRRVLLRPLGTKPIFNGKNLDGWNTDHALNSRFEVTDAGELRMQNGRGQLESNGRYGDFVLQLQCYVNGDNLNSGVFLRCIPGEIMNGYESQIHNGYEGGDRTKPADFGTGGIYRREKARRVVANDREWLSKTIVANGPHFAVWVNGYLVTDWTDTRKPHKNPRSGLRLEPGTLCLQGHDPTTDLRFRNIRLAELGRD